MILNQRGISLIEMLVALGIAGILTMANMSMMQSTAKSQSSLETRTEKIHINNEITSVLANTAACTASLQGLPVEAGKETELPADRVIQDDYGIHVRPNEVFPGGKLKITKIKISDYTPSSADRGIGFLVLEYDETQKLMGGKLRPSSFKMRIEVNPANNTLVSCSGMSGVDVIAEISNQCQVCFRYENDGSEGQQCNGGSENGTPSHRGTICAPIGAWTPKYRDDTDEGHGGCKISWGFDCEAPYGDLIEATYLPINTANNNGGGGGGGGGDSNKNPESYANY